MYDVEILLQLLSEDKKKQKATIEDSLEVFKAP